MCEIVCEGLETFFGRSFGLGVELRRPFWLSRTPSQSPAMAGHEPESLPGALASQAHRVSFFSEEQRNSLEFRDWELYRLNSKGVVGNCIEVNSTVFLNGCSTLY